MNELALFAGTGGGILGGKLLGWKCVCAVEIIDYRRRVLMRRQSDGILHPFPIWDDIRTFDGRPWRGIVDVVSGGFPCQDISCAGKGTGITGERSGLWVEMARVISEVRPSFVFVENSPLLTSRGLGVVLGDLAAMGYNARWGVLSAADAIWNQGTPCLDHLRERIWLLAYDPMRVRHRAKEEQIFTRRNRAIITGAEPCEAIAYSKSTGLERHRTESRAAKITEPRFGDLPSADSYQMRESQQERGEQEIRGRIINGSQEDANSLRKKQKGRENGTRRRSGSASNDDNGRVPGANWWQSESGLARVVYGIPNRVDRIGALGDAQLPQVVKLAWETLSAGFLPDIG